MAKRNPSKPRASTTSIPKVLLSRSAGETGGLGRRLAASLCPGDIVFLRGELGSGKTTLMQGIAAGFGIRGFVRSSSFILVNEYAAAGSGMPVYHMDLYRLSGGETGDFGLDEYLYGKGVCIIEWPERLAGTPVRPNWEIDLAWQDENVRKIIIRREARNAAARPAKSGRRKKS